MAKNTKLLFFVIYAAFGVYFINLLIKFFKNPEFLAKVDAWIIFVGGVLLIFAGLQSLMKKRTY